MVRWLATIIILSLIPVLPANAVNHVKIGKVCLKQGATSKNLVCKKEKGKLLWVAILPKSDKISLSIPTNVYIDQGALEISPMAISGKNIVIASETNSVCSVSERQITPLNLGRCTLRVSTQADKKYRAVSETFSLNIRSKNDFAISLENIYYIDENLPELPRLSSAGLPIDYFSATPNVCQVSDIKIYFAGIGACAILGQQKGNEFVDQSSNKEITFKVFRKNTIAFMPPDSILLTSKTYQLTAVASSGLDVSFTSNSPEICNSSLSILTFLKQGNCLVEARQIGDNFTEPAAVVNARIKVIRGNDIKFNYPASVALKLKSLQLSGISSSGLPLTYKTSTPDFCSVSSNTLSLLKHGNCLVEANQPGDEFTSQAEKVSASIKILRDNEITFVNPASVALKLKSLQLSGFSSSGLPLTYKSLTPSTCATSSSAVTLLAIGSCTVVASQAGDEFTFKAVEVSNTFIVTNDRVLADQPDSLRGYQIKAIYVVPSDGTDRQYDTNGYIASILSEGNTFLKANTGLEYQIDSIASEYDIQFLRSSYSTSHFLSASFLQNDLALEMKLYENPSLDRKNYIFFIDVPFLKNGTACGYAPRPGLLSIYAIGPSNSNSSSCVGQSLNVGNYASKGWVHESFHNLGVGHTTNDSCDLMRGSGSCSSLWTIDKERNKYVGADVLGANILTLRVWKGYTNDQSLRASCTLQSGWIPRSDGLKYAVCPTGKQIIGALTYCTSSIRSVELQIWRNNVWESLGDGNHYQEPWGQYIDWSCDNYSAPWKELTVNTPGIHKYRWIINGRESEVFNIIWQR